MDTKVGHYDIKKFEEYTSLDPGKHYIVLAQNVLTNEWVTWDCTDGNSFFWGHYFQNTKDALYDYYFRLSSKYADN